MTCPGNMEFTASVTVRERTLSAAADCVLRDRNVTYGGVEDSFTKIAAGWSALVGVPISPAQAALMMAWLKTVRAFDNPAHTDSFVDLAGYAACGAECAEGSK